MDHTQLQLILDLIKLALVAGPTTLVIIGLLRLAVR